MSEKVSRRRARGWAIVLGLIALCTLVLLVWGGSERSQAPHGQRPAMRAKSEVREHAIAAARARMVEATRARPSRSAIPKSQLPALPESFKGTTVDGGFLVDARGHLVPTEGALLLFNYFFSASGKESDEIITSRIVHEIRRRLDPPAEDEALALLDDFVSYRRAGRDMAEEIRASTPEEQVEALYALRREVFGEDTADALFKRDEAVRAVQMERTRILKDATLTEAQKRAELEKVDEQLPQDVRERRQQSTAAMHSYQQTERLKAQGATQAEIDEARSKLLGAEAAARLSEEDRREARFAEQLRALRDFAGSLEDVPEPERSKVVEGFIEERFAEPDRARARALMAAGFPTLDAMQKK